MDRRGFLKLLGIGSATLPFLIKEGLAEKLDEDGTHITVLVEMQCERCKKVHRAGVEWERCCAKPRLLANVDPHVALIACQRNADGERLRDVSLHNTHNWGLPAPEEPKTLATPPLPPERENPRTLAKRVLDELEKVKLDEWGL